jgi:anti-sigma factor ChrR (cupin superfamily)
MASSVTLQRVFRLLASSELATEARTFQPFREGVEKATLCHEGGSMAEVALLRYAKGARVPRHAHTGFEYIFILEGSQEDEHGLHVAGSLVINPPGSNHAVFSPDGCVVLAIWERPVEFL